MLSASGARRVHYQRFNGACRKARRRVELELGNECRVSISLFSVRMQMHEASMVSFTSSRALLFSCFAALAILMNVLFLAIARPPSCGIAAVAL